MGGQTQVEAKGECKPCLRRNAAGENKTILEVFRFEMSVGLEIRAEAREEELLEGRVGQEAISLTVYGIWFGARTIVPYSAAESECSKEAEKCNLCQRS